MNHKDTKDTKNDQGCDRAALQLRLLAKWPAPRRSGRVGATAWAVEIGGGVGRYATAKIDMSVGPPRPCCALAVPRGLAGRRGRERCIVSAGALFRERVLHGAEVDLLVFVGTSATDAAGSP